MTLLDGKIIRDEKRAELARRVRALGYAPGLAIVQAGDLEESNAYVRQKLLFGESVGARVEHVRMPESAGADEIAERVRALDADPSIHGIIVQLPLPKGVGKESVIDAIDPEKDVDGLTASCVKRLWAGDPLFVPATARGVITLLDRYGVKLSGKRAVVVGRSMLVGKSVAAALLGRDATVTIAHKHTAELAEVTRPADILVVAAGSAKLVGAAHVSPGQTVVDVGITVVRDGEAGKRRLVGDVDFDAVKDIVGAVSPVPGGVGPLTVASLFENLLDAAERRHG